MAGGSGRARKQSDRSELSDEKVGSGGETPSLADHSGNNTPAGARKVKLKGLKRRDRRAQRRTAGGLTTSEEENSDSAFPARTPENIKALDDLLEEEVPVPGDSGRGSISVPWGGAWIKEGCTRLPWSMSLGVLGAAEAMLMATEEC